MHAGIVGEDRMLIGFSLYLWLVCDTAREFDYAGNYLWGSELHLQRTRERMLHNLIWYADAFLEILSSHGVASWAINLWNSSMLWIISDFTFVN